MKLKRKLIYSILLFGLAVALLIALSLGWFQTVINNEVDDITLYYSGIVFSLSKSNDDDKDGLPDKDGNDIILYSPISSENIEISNLFPLASTAFKIDVSAGLHGGDFNIVFKGLSEPDILTPTVDLADVLRITYTNPITSELVDKSFAELMDENRDVTLYSGYHITGDGEFSFKYTIYMDSSASNEYKNKSLIIDKVIFFVSQ